MENNKEKITKVFSDLYSGVIPEKFPIWDIFGFEYCLNYSGYKMLNIQYQYTEEIFENIIEKVMEISRGDTFDISFARNAVALMLQRSKYLVMSNTGFIQHPEATYMEASEYDEFIKNPFDFIVSTIVPRQVPAYDDDPVLRSLNFAKYVLASIDQRNMMAEANAKVFDRHGLYLPPAGTVGSQMIPFDRISDNFRGFSQIHSDLRRIPGKVEEACEAMMPYAIWTSSKIKPSTLGYASVKTHMGAYLSNKDFEKYYWATFIKLCHINAERGVDMDLFLEHDWSRFIDCLQELPQGARMYMEYGDPKEFKDRLGDKYVLGGFYPMMLLKAGTKQQCIDKAKELIDIMAPGGNFYFRFDKNVITIKDLNIENYIAVMEYLQENSKYSNAGQKSMSGDKEKTIRKGYANDYPEFKTKYFVSFDEFKSQYPYVYPDAEADMRAQYDKYTKTVEAYII